MVKNSKKAAVDPKTKKAVTAKATFTAKAANGSQDVTFTFDDTELAGEDLVVFEKLYRTDGKGKGITDDNLIASHEDLEDKDQTVKVPADRTRKKVTKKTTPKATNKVPSDRIAAPQTGDRNMFIYLMIIAGACVGITAAISKKGRKKQSKE